MQHTIVKRYLNYLKYYYYYYCCCCTIIIHKIFH